MNTDKLAEILTQKAGKGEAIAAMAAVRRCLEVCEQCGNEFGVNANRVLVLAIHSLGSLVLAATEAKGGE